MQEMRLSGLPGLWNLPAWCKAVFSRQQHPVLQFLRYGLAGVAAMVTNLAVFIWCEQILFPVPETAEAAELSWSTAGQLFSILREDLRVANFVKSNAVAFLVANTVAYVLNFLWVFESGRHSRSIEVMLFFGVSLASFTLGTVLASLLVNHGVHPYPAKGADILTAVLVNYVCRKFLIFKG
jgi:putative flippase GtrA